MTESIRKYGVGSIVQHKSLGRGQVLSFDLPFVVIKFPNEIKRVPEEYLELELARDVDQEMEILKFALTEVLSDYGLMETNQTLAKRWVGGEVVLVPGKKDTQEKKIPLDLFFKKIISVREKLRVLEQKVNNHPRLEQEDRIDLQGYITRCYGSLTTFNFLFADPEDGFQGAGGE